MTREPWAEGGRHHTTAQALAAVRRVWTLVDASTDMRRRDRLPRALVALAAQLDGVEGAAVVDLGHDTEPQVVAFSGEDVRHLSQLQLEDPAGGPATDALHADGPVALDVLGAVAGSPSRFIPAARDLGVGHVHAWQLRRRKVPFGSLVVYVHGSEPLASADLAVLQWWVEITAAGLWHRRALRDAERRAHELEHALASRVVIEQAKGVLVGQDAIDASAAFEVLRRRARTARVRVEDVARAVVAHAANPTAAGPASFPRLRSATTTTGPGASAAPSGARRPCE